MPCLKHNILGGHWSSLLASPPCTPSGISGACLSFSPLKLMDPIKKKKMFKMYCLMSPTQYINSLFQIYPPWWRFAQSERKFCSYCCQTICCNLQNVNDLLGANLTKLCPSSLPNISGECLSNCDINLGSSDMPLSLWNSSQIYNETYVHMRANKNHARIIFIAIIKCNLTIERYSWQQQRSPDAVCVQQSVNRERKTSACPKLRLACHALA